MTSVTTRRANGTLYPAYCRGCRSLVGYHFGARSPSLFCPDPICPLVPPTNAYEERDGLLIVLRQTGCYSKERLSAMVGLSRQRISQILSQGYGESVPEQQSP